MTADLHQPVMQEITQVAAFGFRALSGVDGGVETHARELYPRLARLGVHTTALVRSPYRSNLAPPSSTPPSDAGVREKVLWAPAIASLEAIVHSALAALYCIGTRPDLVHVHGIGPSLFVPLLRLCGLRVVMTHHGSDYEASKWSRFARAVLRMGERAGVRTSSEVICVSHYIREYIRRKYGVSGHTIYNGLPSRRSMRVPQDPVLRALEPRRYVLMVGRLTPHKRVEDVIEALDRSRLPGVSLVVCGAGPAKDQYVASIRSRAAKSGRVVLAGFVTPDDLVWVYRHCLCTVMASSYEGMPLAVLEALSCGAPTLVSRIPAHEELQLPPGSYFDLGDVQAITTGIERIARQDPANGSRQSHSAVIDGRFCWDAIAEQTRLVLLGKARVAITPISSEIRT
jgi:glycosyltransferase involved in cell wall biosynthesis